MRKRSLSLLLCLATILTVMCISTVAVHAALYLAEVSSAEEVKYYLEKGDRNIILQNDITVTVSDSTQLWCATKGSNSLDLNGHKLKVINKSGGQSTLISIPEGSELTVYDKAGGGSITYEGDIDSAGTLRYRNIFSVEGILTINSGIIEAGRSVSSYDAAYAKTVYRQTYGSAVVVKNEGTVMVNGGSLYGRGYQVGVIGTSQAGSGSKVILNGGNYYAKGGACIITGSNSSITARGGVFKCETLGAIKINGKTTSGYSLGTTRIPTGSINRARVSIEPSDANSYSASNLKLSPIDDSMNGASLLTAGTKSGSYIYVTKTKARVVNSYDKDACFWPISSKEGGSYSYVESNHDIKYDWYLLDSSGNVVATASKKGQGDYSGTTNCALDFFKDFRDYKTGNLFSPVEGTAYKIYCKTTETLGSSQVKNRSEMCIIIFQDESKAPVITKNPNSTVSYSIGGTVTLEGDASGANVKYVWQRYDSSKGWSDIATSSSKTLTLSNINASYDGARYRLRAYNAAGSVYSSECTLKLSSTAVAPVITDLDVPVHGRTLDTTAGTSTTGCTVTSVKWKTYKDGVLSSTFKPYAGLTLTCEVVVEFKTGYEPGNGATWNGKKNYSTSIPTVTSRCYSFQIDCVPVDGVDAEISNAVLTMTKPEVGKSLYSASAADAGFGTTLGTEVRYTVDSTKWTCDGSSVDTPVLHTVKDGSVYKVTITLKPKTGYKFTSSSKVTINGEAASCTVSGSNLLVTKEYSFKADDPVTPVDPTPYVFPFVDVPSSEWYYQWVKGANQMGLINGVDATHYKPDNNMTYAEAIKLAACMNEKYTKGSVTLGNGTVNWYDTYVEYCMTNGIISQNYASVINSPIDRQTYAAIFAKCLPSSALSAKNTIPDGSIPDVQKSNPNYNAIYTLYKAGIVNGSDAKGTFNPYNNIRRSEVAAILNRMMDSSVRVGAPAELGK